MEANVGAGLIAGMLQGRQHLNPVWDALPPSTIEQFTRKWTAELEQWNEGSVETIVDSITDHEALGPAWSKLDRKTHLAVAEVIEVIAKNVRGGIE